MSRDHGHQPEHIALEAHSESPTNIRTPAYEMNPRSPTSHPTPTNHTLDRTWATQATATGIGGPTQRINAEVAPATKRWMEERIGEQPWNAVGTFTTVPSYKKRHKAGKEMGSNIAVAGTDKEGHELSDK